MKKLLSLSFLALLLGCGSPAVSAPSPSDPASTPTITNETQDTAKASQKSKSSNPAVTTQTNVKSTTVSVVDRCAEKETIGQKKECYLNLAYTIPLDSKDVAGKVCDQIQPRDFKTDNCYWILAMRSKDQTLCEQITSNPTPGSSKDYINQGACKKALSYATANAQWNLKSGMPFDEAVYGGRAVLTGTYKMAPSYVGDSVAHFQVSASSINDLPFLSQNYATLNLTLNEKSILSELEKYVSDGQPITIIATEIIYRLEGTPFIKISEIQK